MWGATAAVSAEAVVSVVSVAEAVAKVREHDLQLEQ